MAVQPVRGSTALPVAETVTPGKPRVRSNRMGADKAKLLRRGALEKQRALLGRAQVRSEPGRPRSTRTRHERV